MYLLDTMVISELRKKSPNPDVLSWLQTRKYAGHFISVISIGEIQRGIAGQREKAPIFCERLSQWLDDVIVSFGKRILPITIEISKQWGAISARIGNNGPDNLIAATAIVHGLIVATRNTKHFAATGARFFNPWDN